MSRTIPPCLHPAVISATLVGEVAVFQRSEATQEMRAWMRHRQEPWQSVPVNGDLDDPTSTYRDEPLPCGSPAGLSEVLLRLLFPMGKAVELEGNVLDELLAAHLCTEFLRGIDVLELGPARVSA